MLIIVLWLVVLTACVPKLCVQLYSCCPVWQLVVHLLRYVNIVIKAYYYYYYYYYSNKSHSSGNLHGALADIGLQLLIG